MKFLVYLFPALLFILGGTTTMAADVTAPAPVMVMASNGVELDVTMEMLGEDAQSSADIVHVIELPAQEMHPEQIRNQRRIRQQSSALPLRQEEGSPNAVQNEIPQPIHEFQRNAEGDMGSKKGR
ncbi:MAG: hypothetical protein RI601_10690 [Desulfurivibrionaceae bacterium]|nr:hypothetical protein [Desulfurivibrionaceae bacterium]